VGHAKLNVLATTYPLDPNEVPNCLNGIEPENLSIASRSFHELPPDLLAGQKKSS
jgi:hypothetical protein